MDQNYVINRVIVLFMNLQIRPLGKVRQIVESIGMDISYAYDDLVFSDHSLFIIQFFDKDPKVLYLHFNIECEQKEAVSVEKKLKLACTDAGFNLKRIGRFALRQLDGDESLEISFLS